MARQLNLPLPPEVLPPRMVCRICGEEKDCEEFVINHTTPVKVHYKDICKDCANEKTKLITVLRECHPYPDEDYICPICNTKADKYYLDHDWKTKKFRGYLCNGCNVMLGLMKDDKEMLKRAIKYLKRTK